MKNKYFNFQFSIFNFLLLLCLALTGCKKFEGDVTAPTWLQVDRVDVVKAASGENERSSGWYTSDIDAVEIVALFHGDNKETELGVFQLPCRVPVLREGLADYVTVRPVIKQNGIAATRIYYTFLQSNTTDSVLFTSGQTTFLGTYDNSLQCHTVNVSYWGTDRIDELFFENFEPLASAIRMTEGKYEWITDDANGACTGSGYLRIPTAADGDGTYLEIIDSMRVEDKSKYIYLEMDYRSDVEFRIGLRSPITEGGNDYTYYAVGLYPTQQWTKIYINLGKLWSQMNHYPEFHVAFRTLNLDNTEGYTYIDNLKIITM